MVAVLFDVITSIAAACIYREDLPRVTTSRNRLGLSLSKRIRHGLVAKINGKRRLWTCEALGRILADYSCTRYASVSIASPRHATPHPARRASAHTRVFLPFSSPPHTCKCRATHIISRLLSTFTSKVGLKSCHPPCMNGPF
jgi:hypothetical protein